MKNIKNFIQINEKIATAGQPTKKQFKLIAKAGYEVVLNLAMHNKGALKEEDKIVSKNGMLYIHIPITWDDPELDKFTFALQTLKHLQRLEKKVFVHCIMNWRVSMLIYQYKKSVLFKKNVKLKAPDDFENNKKWEKILKLDLKDI
jgi:protein tyrosine phosphatase (PTP) superfamily phosphohydrolase (DUF442 family)